MYISKIKNKKGLSLIELLITIAIIAFSFTALISSINYAMRFYLKAKENNIVNFIAQRELALLKLKFKYSNSYVPLSINNVTINDVVTNIPLPEYQGWKYDMIVENNDVTPNGQTLHGRIKKITFIFTSPSKNYFNYVTYLTVGGNNN